MLFNSAPEYHLALFKPDSKALEKGQEEEVISVKPSWTVLIYYDDETFKRVNQQYLNLIHKQNFEVDIQFVYFKALRNGEN